MVGTAGGISISKRFAAAVPGVVVALTPGVVLVGAAAVTIAFAMFFDIRGDRWDDLARLLGSRSSREPRRYLARSSSAKVRPDVQ